MAGKFRIFCDDCPISAYEPGDKEASGVNQNGQNNQAALAAIVQQQQQVAAKLAATSTGTTTASTMMANTNSSSSSSSVHNDQEKLMPLEQAAVSGITKRLPLKREPLGLRQASSQPQMAHAEATAISIPAQGSSTLGEEDRENDISMASLGSDFVPSISHGDDDLGGDSDFEVEESQLDGPLTSYRDFEANESVLIDYEDDDDDDFGDDEELQKELSAAFKQHDDSQLFKSTAYIDDIQSYLKQLERIPDLRPLPNYMDLQGDINSEKRTILTNWLIEVADEFNLQSETLFICINIIDRFLTKISVPTHNFQLLGVAAMFIASKYEEIYPPELYQFVEVTDETYSGKQICHMEQEILKTLDFRISLPSISYFLNQIFAFNKFAKKIYHLAEYLCYLTLLVDQPFLEYYPSEIALAAVILAAHQCDAAANISPELKVAYDRSNLDQLNRRNTPKGTKARDVDRRKFTVNKQLPFCIESLREIQHRAYSKAPPLNGDSAVVNRFSTESLNCVASLPPPKIEDLYLY